LLLIANKTKAYYEIVAGLQGYNQILAD